MPTPRHRHLRNVVVSLAAATAVVLGPTACDLGIGAPSAAPPPAAGEGAGPTSVAAVPVGSVEDLEPTPAPTSAGEAPAAGGGAAPGSDAPEESEAPVEGAPPADGEAPADGEEPAEGEAPVEGEEPAATTAPETSAPVTTAPAAPPAAPGLETLGGDCTGSDLEAHDGFQKAPRCVSIAMGEVPAENQSPAILIVESPDEVNAGEAFEIVVSSCNLVRDRFLGAAAGGYYRESSFLNEEGLVRGHFHTAVQSIGGAAEAPDATPVPAFFLATQDNGGGAGCDEVRVPITVKDPGTYRISTWAGDGSHRTPMMQRANQTPAFDTVRLTVN
jgi:hypothetical protein